MSEVDWKVAHDMVLAHHRETFAELRSDIDRVTAERDAVRETLENSYTAEDHERLVAKGQELNVKYIEKLEQRLTAADERADVLEAQLAESRKITLSGCEFSEHDLIRRAVRAASGASRRGTQRWVAMKDAFGCGSGVANALCHRFGFDPDEMVKP